MFSILYKRMLKLAEMNNYNELYKCAYELYEKSDNKESAVVIVKLLDYLCSADDYGQCLIASYDEEKENSDFKEKITREEMILFYSYIGKFSQALGNIRSYRKKNDGYDYYYEILHALNKMNIKKLSSMDKVLDKLVKSSDYNSIHEFLMNEYQKHNLVKKHRIILQLTEELIKIDEGEYSPINTEVGKEDLYSLIENRNYEEAKRYIEEEFKNPSTNIVYIFISLLVKKLNYIDEICGIDDKINNVRKIIDLASSTIDNIDEVAEIFEFSDEEKLIYKVLFAERSYIEHNPVMGDKLIREVERVKNKSSAVKYILNNTIKCKKIYMNRTYQLVNR